MQRILLVLPTATYRATEFLAAAESLGVEVVVASEADQAMAENRADRFLVVPLDDPDGAARAAAAFARRVTLDAVVAVDDEGSLAAAAIAEQLGLARNPRSAIEATRDKPMMRALFAANDVRQPRYLVVERDERGENVARAGAQIGFPVVVKPPSLGASRGVVRVDDQAAARLAADLAGRAADEAGCPPDTPLLVEEFIPGDEVAVECLLDDGDLSVLAVFDKPDPLNGPYFEETIYTTPSRHDEAVLGRLARTVAAGCRALGLRNGPVHAEARLSPSGADPDADVVMLEAAARTIGGKCAKALRFAAGRSLEEIVLAQAVGIDLRATMSEGASGVMMLPVPATGRFEGIKGKEAALSIEGITGLEVTVPVGRQIVEWPLGDRYLGFLFSRGDDPAKCEWSLREAQALLDVEITPVEKGAR